jgi:hypothetical protein
LSTNESTTSIKFGLSARREKPESPNDIVPAPIVIAASASLTEADRNSIKKVIVTAVINEPNRNNKALYLIAAIVFLVHKMIRPAIMAANIPCQKE